MVTSQKMNENKMGYRGSKSLCFLNKKNSVKEQRVDGSCFINNTKLMKLRCTLMGFERNYPIKNPSKQLKKNFSTFNYPSKIEPWFLTGFTDAEGSFTIIVDKNNKRKLGWSYLKEDSN
jgi:hypothetical protein